MDISVPAHLGLLGENNRNEKKLRCCGKECQVLETCRIDGVKGCFKSTGIEGFTISEKHANFPKSEYTWMKEEETPPPPVNHFVVFLVIFSVSQPPCSSPLRTDSAVSSVIWIVLVNQSMDAVICAVHAPQRYT